jgi:hypothetical protein
VTFDPLCNAEKRLWGLIEKKRERKELNLVGQVMGQVHTGEGYGERERIIFAARPR